MDSLGRLADNLPRQSSNALNAAEQELQSAFRGSALAITTLLRAAQSTTKKSFEAGYSAALQDVLEFVQQGLDIHPQEGSSSGAHPHSRVNSQQQGVTQVIDYIEARREAVRLAAADNDGDDDVDALQHLKVAPPVSLYHHQQQRPTSHAAMQPAPAQQRHPHLAADPAACRRQSSRSVSPSAVRSRSSAPPASSASTSPHAQRNAHSTHHSPTHRGTSIDITTSSSVSASPGMRSANNTFDFQFAQPAHSHIDPLQAATTPQSDSSNNTTLVNTASAQSPITRLQAKRGKDRDRKGHRSHLREARGKDTEGDHERDVTTVGMKRRWTAAMAPSAVDIDNTAAQADSASAASSLFGDAALDVETFVREAADADMEDGSSRPAKRTNRR